ncbi:DNA-binding protein [Cetobacterium sp. 2A]|uniref:PPC domain-containing DNA-binding protein n=1 Tax=Cetobacterium sp. 2A TaxID=2754723 RepID=UPI00163D375E|nr:PPC domain-containing DNA-binding protein [Cetobacterium sp. 2A]MBC2854958.1 DNA-binding protein [Cetobacterium sp. 2A]
MIHILELKKGEIVKDKIKEFFETTNWEEAYVMSGLGSLVDVKLTNAADFNIPPKVKMTCFEGPFEALSLFGEVKKQSNETFVHIHLCGSLSNSETHGGGLFHAEVFRGLRVYLQKIK